MRIPVRRLVAALSVLSLVIGGLATFSSAANAADGPSITTQITESTPTSLKVKVIGSGYDATAPGVYVGISESGGASHLDSSAQRGTEWIRHTAIGDGGAFETTLTLDAAVIATLDPAETYSVYTFKAHGDADRTQDVEKTIPLDFASLGLTEPEPEPSAPAIDAEITATTPDELSIKVTGNGFDRTSPGVNVALGHTFSATDSSIYVKAAWVRDTAIGEGGTFETTLTLNTAQVASLDRTKTYSIYTMKAHGSSDRSQDVVTTLALDWDSLSPGQDPAIDAQITASTPDELSIKVIGNGFDRTSPGVNVALGHTFSATDSKAYAKAAWVRDTAIGEGGTFETTLSLNADQIAGLDRTKTYSIYTMKAHGSPDRSQDVVKTLTLDWDSLNPAGPDPTGPAITAQVVESTPTSLKVRVNGTRYEATAPGIYAGISESGGGSSTDPSTYRGTQWVAASAIGDDGSFETTLSLDAAAIATLDRAKAYSVYTMKAHGSTDRSQDAELALTLDWDSLGLTEPDPGTDPGTDPAPAPGGDRPASAGHLTWGVNASFRSYVTGPIAKGSIAVGDGAATSGSAFRFPQSGTNAKQANGIGTTSYRGSVAFRGHAGALSLKLSAPRVTVKSGSSATLSMIVDGRRLAIAALDLAKAKVSTAKGGVTFRNAPARLTTEGASAFNGFYAPGQSMDPLTFAIGANSSASGGGMTTVAAAAVKASWTPPATPPSTQGLDVAFDNPDGIVGGASFTASATGFVPNEKDIKVVVYSAPVILEKSLTADASGKATWTGLLPSSLESGEHTLTFQGSVNRGVTFTIKDDDTDSEFCSITDASFVWGVKESFRSYISGSIAGGDWKTSGKASYETPVFTFTDGHGGFDAKGPQGEIEFDGSIDFSGHEGALTVELADPTLKIIDARTAYLLFDTTSGSMESAMDGDARTTATEDVPVVRLDLSKASLKTGADGTTTATAVPTELTVQGEKVFSNYDAGAAFDPIDLTITSADDCASGDVASAEVATPIAATTAADTDGMSALWWVLIGLAAVTVVGGAAFWTGRRSAAS